MPTKPEYKRVSREYLDRILDSPGETYEPRGLFLCDQWIGGVQIWTAMRVKAEINRIERAIMGD